MITYAARVILFTSVNLNRNFQKKTNTPFLPVIFFSSRRIRYYMGILFFNLIFYRLDNRHRRTIAIIASIIGRYMSCCLLLSSRTILIVSSSSIRSRRTPQYLQSNNVDTTTIRLANINKSNFLTNHVYNPLVPTTSSVFLKHYGRRILKIVSIVVLYV